MYFLLGNLMNQIFNFNDKIMKYGMIFIVVVNKLDTFILCVSIHLFRIEGEKAK